MQATMEVICKLLMATVYWSTTLYLILYQGWNWKWIIFGAVISFLAFSLNFTNRHNTRTGNTPENKTDG